MCTKVLGVMGEYIRVSFSWVVGGFGGVNMGVGLGRGLVLMVWPVGVTHCSLVGDIFCLLLAANGFVSSSFFTIVDDRLGVVVDGGLVFVVLLSLLVVAVAVTVVVLAVVVSGLGWGLIYKFRNR